jgi:hypothetical protein
MNFATTRILTRNPAEPWVVMSLRLNIQDFEEELQPNALLAAIQSMEKRKINLEHVHGLSTSSDSKATGEGKERRQTCCDTELCLPYTFCSS